MGTLEKESRRGTRKHLLQKAILTTVATAGLLSVAAVAPNALQALGLLMNAGGKKHKNFYSIETSRKRLIQRGLLAYNSQQLLRLTKKGEMTLRQLQLKDVGLTKPRRWDRKWRLITFDIRESQRKLREKIRRTLVHIGFEQLQKSVWIYPYDCEDFITLIKADFHIGKNVLYVIADKVENDKYLRERFGLPLSR